MSAGKSAAIAVPKPFKGVVFDIISLFTNIARMGQRPTKVAVGPWHCPKLTSRV